MPQNLPDVLHGPYARVVFFAMFASVWLEMIFDLFRHDKRYEWRDALVNFGVACGTAVVSTAFQTAQYFICLEVARFSLSTITVSSWWSWVIVYLILDIVIYWKHRIMHVWEPLWAFHLVHHNSERLNLSTGFRLNWFEPLVNIPFMIPLVWLGLPAEAVLICYSINHTYQFWPHTQAISLGWLDSFLNTPRNHWVHHGSNEKYVNKNFSGTFIIWDRLFGTYARYEEPARFGITTPFKSFNLLKVEFHGMFDLIRGRLSYRG